MPRYLTCTIFSALLLPLFLHAQALRHPDPLLTHIYPAGAQQGQTVTVELGGAGGLDRASGLVIDGPPGISVRVVKAGTSIEAKAILQIAADAVPGLRWLRVLGAANGLTNARPFFIGKLPEVVEKEPNDTPDRAQEVAFPVVINGRIHPNVDVDCFRFQAHAGQKLVAGILAHGMDSLLRATSVGFLDTSLEVLDEQGKIVAAAEDTVGLDPVLEFTVQTTGWHTLRVTSLANVGGAGAVYRLTLGGVIYPTAVFPPGGQRGQRVAVEFAGVNVPPGTRRTIDVPPTGDHPLLHLGLDGKNAATVDIPFVCGDLPELSETEPRSRSQAQLLQLPVTVNGRFLKAGSESWFRVHLKKGAGLLLEVMAQRYLRSPVDTLLEIQDAAGQKLAENDDGLLFSGQCEHDFPSADSRLQFSAPADGDYFIRLREQSGASGLRAVYRLTATVLQPDFRLFLWPDAVPVWGPGTTSSFVVQLQRWGGFTGDIQLRIEGLPRGWTGSAGYLPTNSYVSPGGPTHQKVLLTITAPVTAKPGDLASFRVVGSGGPVGKRLEQVALPLTLYGSSFNDRMHLRASSQARAVVAEPLDCWLETSVKELSVVRGGTVNIPVKIHRHGKAQLAITVDGETPAAGCGWRVPLTLKADQNEVLLPLTVPQERLPGIYGIVVSRSWASDLRAGRPGPCTPLIRLEVKEK